MRCAMITKLCLQTTLVVQRCLSTGSQIHVTLTAEATIAAEDFTDFITGHFIGLAIGIWEALYWGPLLECTG